MEVTRNIVIDLLPLYESGEASPDTRAAVEDFMRRDPSIARLTARVEEQSPPTRPPTGLERQAVARTRAAIRRRAWTLALAVFFTTVPFTFVIRDDAITFFMFRDEPGSRLFLIAAAWLWIEYVRLTRKLRTSGL
jgi:hypothetical protein